MAKYLCIWVRAYWFSVTSFSKWLLGGHIRFFSFWMAWFWQRNSSLLWNFSFKFHVHVLCGCRQKPNDCQLCRFQNGCLVILNNAQLQSTHCPLPPSPMGRGYPSRSLIYNFYLFFGPKPLHEPLFTICPVDTWQQTAITFNSKYQCFLWWKCISKCHLQKLQPFYSGLVFNNYGAKMFLHLFIISMV